MKKLKFSFGEGGFQGWLIRHVEKIVLGVVLVLVVYFVYQGATLEGFDKTPQDLANSMARAQQTMNTNHWDVIQKDFPPVERTPDVRVAEGTQPVNYNLYPDGPIVPAKAEQRTLRGDPVLVKPEQLEVIAFHGPMLSLKRGLTDPFEGDTPAEEREEVIPDRQGQPITIESTGRRLDLSRTAKRRLAPYAPKANGKAVVKAEAVAAVRCLVDVQKQMEAFEEALPNLTGAESFKDKPSYIYFYVEYEEFKTGTQPTGNWTGQLSKGTFSKDEVEYGGEHSEVVDANFLHPVLTRKIPPLLLADPIDFGKHSQTPLRKSLLAMQQQLNMAAGNQPADVPITEDDPLNPLDGDPLADDRPGDEKDPEDNPPMEKAGEYKYLLVRFFHVGLKPGMSYRYRVRVLLEDPNNPQDPTARPDLRSLDNEARARVAEIRKQEKENSKPQYYRITEWSDASEPVSIPTYGGIFGGMVTQGRSVPVNGVPVKKEADSGKLLVVEWDARRATRIPGEMRVKLGSTLDRTLDVNVLNPVTIQLRSILGHKFGTPAVVVDMRGGKPIAKGSEISTPGEIAVFTEAGKMFTTNELDDIESYREELFLDQLSTSAGGGPILPGDEGQFNDGEDLLFEGEEAGLFEREFGRGR